MESPDKHVESVREKLLQRSIIGLNKYGVTTERQDLSDIDWLKHCQEEMMDSCIYLETLIQRHSNE